VPGRMAGCAGGGRRGSAERRSRTGVGRGRAPERDGEPGAPSHAQAPDQPMPTASRLLQAVLAARRGLASPCDVIDESRPGNPKAKRRTCPPTPTPTPTPTRSRGDGLRLRADDLRRRQPPHLQSHRGRRRPPLARRGVRGAVPPRRALVVSTEEASAEHAAITPRPTRSMEGQSATRRGRSRAAHRSRASSRARPARPDRCRPAPRRSGPRRGRWGCSLRGRP